MRQIERHKNGQIAYLCRWHEVPPLFEDNFPNRIIEESTGKIKIRVGWCAKFYDNRQLAWCLKYDKMGNLIAGSHKAFRRNGSRIN